MSVELGCNGISLEEFQRVAYDGEAVFLGEAAQGKIVGSAAGLAKMLEAGERIYGVTTSYGTQSSARIMPGDYSEFQLDTIRSHSCGTGALLGFAQGRGVWLCKVSAIATGKTGASLGLALQLCELLNTGLSPAIPQTGSLGASGDLVPSGHAGLPLLLEGEVIDRDLTLSPGSSLAQSFGLSPLSLGPRDGLSMVNGTAVTLSLTVDLTLFARRLLACADQLVAAGVEVTGGHDDAFSSSIADAIPHSGTQGSARAIREGLRGCPSENLNLRGVHDAYSWRCAPQVHGAAHFALSGLIEVVSGQLKGCSDNPLLIEDQGWRVVSGGGFHAAPLGVATDALVVALAQLSALARQRCYQILSGKAGFGVGLVPNDQIRNGFSQLLATATALHLEIASMHPPSMHPYPLDEVEDHVSNATLSARRAREALDAFSAILAVEALLIAQASSLSAVEAQGAALRRFLLWDHHLGTTDANPKRLDLMLERMRKFLLSQDWESTSVALGDT